MKILKNKYLSTGLFTFSLLAIMYSFGTFGFFNLLGARTIVQIFVIGLISCLFVALQPRYKQQDLFPFLILFCLYTISSLVHGNTTIDLMEAVILLFVIHVILSAPARQVLFLTKTLVVVTSFLCLLVAAAYIYYRIHPDQLSYANFSIYNSEVGQQKIYAGHFMDWISFTSGEGFEFLGEKSFRMKGYSIEPSATVVHYLAPAVLAILLGGGFIYLGVFILLVNFIAIASFTSLIIAALSFAFFITIRYFRYYLKYIAFILIVLFIVLLTQSALLQIIFQYTGDQANHYLGFDLISRKLGEGEGSQSSLIERQDGIINGFALILSSPFGYSAEKLGAGAGLLFLVASRAGWIGLVILGNFMYKFISNLKKLALASSLPEVEISLTLLVAVLLIVIFVSGYGWERPPGVIMLFLFFRVFRQSFVDGYLAGHHPTGKYRKRIGSFNRRIHAE
jgi:hypothetical protein